MNTISTGVPDGMPPIPQVFTGIISNRARVRKIRIVPGYRPWMVTGISHGTQFFDTWRQAMDYATAHRVT